MLKHMQERAMSFPRRLLPLGLFAFVFIWVLVVWHLQQALEQQLLLQNQQDRSARHSVPMAPVTLQEGYIIVNDEGNKKSSSTLDLTRSHVQPSTDYVIDPQDLWEGDQHNTSLPAWMKDYFRWHKESTDAKNSNTLLLFCPRGSVKCGGLVDRLSPLVFLVYLASRTHRRLLIHWGRPAALEEFLLPPIHGVDWRYDASKFAGNNGVLVTTLESLIQATQSQINVVRCRFQAPDHGAAFYDAHQPHGDPTMAQLTRTVWDLFFTPSPPVARRIQDYFEQNHLVQGAYLATHVRALYAVSDQDPYVVQYWTYNAVNCTTQLARSQTQDSNTIFVASDASFASKIARRYGQQHGWNIIFHTPEVGQEPLHLDKAKNWQNRSPSDYYDSFVDLYLLGLADCVTYGLGGYGKFSSWLTGHPSCGMQHHNATAINECTLAVPPHGRDRAGQAGDLNFLRPVT